MTTTARVTMVAKVSELGSGRPVLQLWTDCPEPCSAVYIDRVEPHPEAGDVVTWGPRHLTWSGGKLKKIGWSFDPNKPR